jgi:hypothetical protein
VKRLVILAVVAIVATGACSSGSSKSSSSKQTDWDPAALQVADGLKDKLVAAKTTCNQYIHWDYPLLTSNYEKANLPIPAAVTTCQGDGAEDLTTEVFKDAKAKDAYVAAKTKTLCAAAANKKIDYPGFPYIDGGNWIFEPDNESTAVDVQKVLGGTVKQAGCKKT